MCVRKDKDVLEDKWRSSNSEREHEQIERVVQESGGKLTRRLANSQVRASFLPPTSSVSQTSTDCICHRSFHHSSIHRRVSQVWLSWELKDKVSLIKPRLTLKSQSSYLSYLWPRITECIITPGSRILFSQVTAELTSFSNKTLRTEKLWHIRAQ